MVKVYLDNETKELQKDSQSKSTKRSYENDWKKFIKYCQKFRNYHPLDVDDDENSVYNLVSNYLRWLQEDINSVTFKGKSEKDHFKNNNVKQNPYSNEKYKSATIERILASITWYYTNNSLTKKSPNYGNYIIFNRKNKDIQKTMESIKNQNKEIKINEAKALVKADVIKIIDKIKKNSTNLTDIRDRALILLGFYSFCRRSEILNLKYEDLEFDKEDIYLNIRFSKTDPTGKGRPVFIPFKNDDYCPVSALKVWLDAAQIKSGPLFYKITKSKKKDDFKRIEKYTLNKKNKVVSLSDTSFNKILKDRAFNAGYDKENISGHSLRRGAITEAKRKNIPIESIQAQSGHSSIEMIYKYTEKENLREVSAAKEL